MSSDNGKKVLIMGLTSGIDPGHQGLEWTSEKVMESVKRDFQQAKEAGFDLENYMVDLSKPEDMTLDEVRVMLKKTHWDGVSIGFGLRGNENNTALFEKLVNTVVEEVQPLPKFIFALRPDLIWEAVSRVFEVGQE